MHQSMILFKAYTFSPTVPFKPNECVFCKIHQRKVLLFLNFSRKKKKTQRKLFSNRRKKTIHQRVNPHSQRSQKPYLYGNKERLLIATKRFKLVTSSNAKIKNTQHKYVYINRYKLNVKNFFFNPLIMANNKNTHYK